MVRTSSASVVGLACFAALCWAAIARGADPPARTGSNAAESKAAVDTTYRASKLTGLYVRNHQGEKLGSIDDLVIDMHTGKVAYAALGVGGVLGIGEKLFAIPFNQMTFERNKDEMHFVLDISKEKLQSAPGFDKRDWPNFADPNWVRDVDNYYRHAATTTTTTKTVTTSEKK